MSNTLHGLARRTAMAGVLAGLGLLGLAREALALDHPSALALDAAGNLYVANEGDFEQGRPGDVEIYSVKVNVKTSVVTATLTATITSNIATPTSVAVSPFGKVYAGNLASDTITVYGTDFASGLAQSGTISDPSIVSYPVSMFVDGDGDLFVLDNGSKVHIYLDNLASAGTVTLNGTAVAMNPWASDLAVWGNFPASGIGITTFTGNMGEGVHNNGDLSASADYFTNGGLLPTGVAEDSAHNQYATNSSLATITVYGPTFSKVSSFPGYGSAIAVDSIRKLIYTAVPSSSLVFVYSLKPPYKYLGQF